MPYCELCAKIRPLGSTKSGPASKNFAPRPTVERGEASAEWFDTDERPASAASTASSGSARGGSSASSRSTPSSAGGTADARRVRPGQGRTVDEPLRPPNARGGMPKLWAGTAADRDAMLDRERQVREAARAQGARGGGGGGSARASRSSSSGGGSAYRPPPRRAPPPVEPYDDESSDEGDWYDAHIASRWAKSKQQQAERDAVQDEKQAKRNAEAEEEAAQRRRDAQAAREAELEEAKACEKGWDAFAQLGDDAVIRMRDVPWPVLDAASLGLDPRLYDKAQRKAAFRQASLRWHPDKFLQSFGSRLVEEEREAILQRVTEVAQAINQIRQEAKRSGQ